jgi:hypothetical protein
VTRSVLPAAKEMDEPEKCPDENDEPHGLDLVVSEIPDESLGGSAEKVPHVPDNNRPEDGANDIEQDEVTGGNPAHADDERRDNAHPVDETESDYQRGLVSLERVVGVVYTLPPPGVL